MDNETLKQQIDVLEKRLAMLERADNVDSLKYWREKLVGREYGANDGAVDRTITIPALGGSENILDFPDGYIDMSKPNGERVRVPYYSLNRF